MPDQSNPGINWNSLATAYPNMKQGIIGQAQPAPAPSSDSGIGELFSGLKGLLGKSGKQAGSDASNPQLPNSMQYSGLGQNSLNQQLNANQGSGLQGALQQATQLEGLMPNNPTLKSYLQKANPNLDPSTTPWCAGFVGSVLNSAGEKGTGSLAAKSYLNYGQPTQSPNKGDIVVFNDLTGRNDPNHGHVGFVDHIQDGLVYTLGGNQSGTVSMKAYPINMVAGFRVPPSGDEVKRYAQQNNIKSPAILSQVPNYINSKQMTAGPAQASQLQYQANYLPQNASPELPHVMSAIAQNETQGAKDAYSSITRSKSGEAVGKYQIMNFNIPSWTNQALGHPMTIGEFKNSPEAQEKTAAYMINNYIEKYGVAGAMRAWIGGEGAAKEGARDNAKDSLGTSVKQYEQQGLRHYLNSKDGSSLSEPIPTGRMKPGEVGSPNNRQQPFAPGLPPIKTAFNAGSGSNPAISFNQPVETSNTNSNQTLSMANPNQIDWVILNKMFGKSKG